MDASGQLLAPERNDLKRYSVEITNNSNPAPTARSRKANRTPSFYEVAAQVSSNTMRAKNIKSTLPEPKQVKPQNTFSLWKNSEMGFGDFIDIINPLQHLPIVATIYRNKTGETIGLASRVIGGALWGRIGGFVASVVNGIVDWFTGKDIGDHIYSAFFGKSGESGKDRIIAKPAKVAFDAGKSQRAVFPAVSETSDTMESAFGDFNDDGGFFRNTTSFEVGAIIGVATDSCHY